ncbi:uncharacterized protein EV422DRAFT_511105 [Fimicolochytrium jonesii]|uniref:uncharacterized protein n=1 Tax=Fimicolochytrium jonesii TaxID=1396493 RepID=UPI0022FE13D3|nr:uncharacterized protein EV422DRAFT_511105 [Fimicolochytrium jonesii]KAI8826693.1 hypothetical protein EV422DRAFT_511105 [Fimicolochytrium jonesii]
MLCKPLLLVSATIVALSGRTEAQIDTVLGPVSNTLLGPTPFNAWIPELLVDTGIGRLMVAKVGQENCKRWASGPVGEDGSKPVMVEDIVMHRPTKTAFLGSDPYRIRPNKTAGWMPGMAFLDAEYGKQGNGAIFTYLYAKDTAGTGEQGLTKLTITPPLPSFHPHGMKILPKVDSTAIRLFVVNHRAQTPYNPDSLYSVVEVLEYDPKVSTTTLKHIKTIEDPLIFTPNNVAPTSATSFYVSNDHGNRAGAARSLEEYGQLPLSWISYCDFSTGTVKCIKAFEGMRGANGMNTDGKIIYANEATGGDVVAFEQNADHTLSVHKRYNLDYIPDNLSYDPDTKNLTPAGHPNAFTFQDYAAGKKSIAPSWVDVIRPDGTTKRIWSDDGNLVSGSTVFEVDSKQNVALVSGVFETHGVVRCTVPKGFLG